MRHVEFINAISEWLFSYLRRVYPELQEETSLTEQVNRFIEANQPYLAQLLWSQHNPFQTGQLSKQNDGFAVVHEARRALIRLLNIDLIKENNLDAFTLSQPEEKKLTREAFERQLHQPIVNMDDEQYAALKIATILASIPLCDEAQNAVRSRGQEPVKDSVKFLHQSMQLALADPTIYPILDGQPQTVLNHVATMLLDYAHFRHILFIEGGAKMFAQLRKMSPDQHQLWSMFWRINLAGFEGDKPDKLTGHMYSIWNASCIQILDDILQPCVSLPLSDRPSTQTIFEAYLAQLSVEYGIPAEGDQQTHSLTQAIALYKLSPDDIVNFDFQSQFSLHGQAFSRYCTLLREHDHLPTPTYVPLFIEQVNDACVALGNTPAEAMQHSLEICGYVLEQSLLQYQAAIAAGEEHKSGSSASTTLFGYAHNQQTTIKPNDLLPLSFRLYTARNEENLSRISEIVNHHLATGALDSTPIELNEEFELLPNSIRPPSTSSRV